MPDLDQSSPVSGINKETPFFPPYSPTSSQNILSCDKSSSLNLAVDRLLLKRQQRNVKMEAKVNLAAH